MDLQCLVDLLCEEGVPRLREDATDAPDKEQEEKKGGPVEALGGTEGGTLSGGPSSQEVRGRGREGDERRKGREGRGRRMTGRYVVYNIRVI